MKESKKPLSLLFIGNSHTYFNDMPLMVKQRAEDAGYDCHVTMIARGGWFLSQHVAEPDVRFNILFGKYDYVVLQEHAQPLSSPEEFTEAMRTLCDWSREAGSTPILYENWALQSEPEKQEEMNRVYRQVAEACGALKVPVGANWWDYQKSWPEIQMYAPDGAHASERGSDFAAKYIWETIYSDLRKG